MNKEDSLREKLLDGHVMLVDKPFRWTSFDVVNKIKSMLRYRLSLKKIKIGHAGTLDPLATGLLIICTGKATKQIDQYQGLDKTYTGTFMMGQVTPSYDLETSPEKDLPFRHITPEQIDEAMQQLTGEQQQLPPIYSAKKIKGERAYHYARQGRETTLKTNTIRIKSFEAIRTDLPEVDFRVTCSKGTYIRSLARDLGELLGCGAYLSALRRTHIGNYSADNALSMEALIREFDQFR
ncbi:MAG: tRNA pseudouridine(55) synthase TruB [Bacteroidales bacterium]